MKTLANTFIIISISLLSACANTAPLPINNAANESSAYSSFLNTAEYDDVQITPIEHATMVLQWNNVVLYTDPVGGAAAFAAQPQPTLILITDIHGDHLDVPTLSSIAGDSVIIAPQAVYEQLPTELQEQTIILANDQIIEEQGLQIEGIAMYNMPESADAKHTKGRGNGYILERDGTRVYISGDTGNIPEMQALQNIDIAFVSMNLPYTMSPTEAAAAVLAFAPKQVYPYHYREPDGLANVALFKQLVEAGNPTIEVVQLDWYPQP